MYKVTGRQTYKLVDLLHICELNQFLIVGCGLWITAARLE